MTSQSRNLKVRLDVKRSLHNISSFPPQTIASLHTFIHDDRHSGWGKLTVSVCFNINCMHIRSDGLTGLSFQCTEESAYQLEGSDMCGLTCLYKINIVVQVHNPVHSPVDGPGFTPSPFHCYRHFHTTCTGPTVPILHYNARTFTFYQLINTPMHAGLPYTC